MKLIKCSRLKFDSVCRAIVLSLNIEGSFGNYPALRNVVIVSVWDIFGFFCVKVGCKAGKGGMHRTCGKLRIENRNSVRDSFVGFFFVEQYSVSVSRYFFLLFRFPLNIVSSLYEFFFLCLFYLRRGILPTFSLPIFDSCFRSKYI